MLFYSFKGISWLFAAARNKLKPATIESILFLKKNHFFLFSKNYFIHLPIVSYELILNSYTYRIDRLVELRLLIKSMQRQSKKCDMDEVSAKNNAKICFKRGDIEKARIFVENAVRHRKQSQHYQMIIARLSPTVQQLMDDLTGRTNSINLNELDAILKDVNVLGTRNTFSVSQTDIDNMVNHLNNGDGNRSATYSEPPIVDGQLNDLEQRLANLRRKNL